MSAGPPARAASDRSIPESRKRFPARNSPWWPTIPFSVTGIGSRHPTDGPRGGFGMTRKNALYALAVFVLMGSMAVVALADDRGMNMYGPPDASLSADPERSLGQLDVWEIRGPAETGAVPDRAESSPGLHSNPPSGDAPTVEYGGVTFRPDIDIGP